MMIDTVTVGLAVDVLGGRDALVARGWDDGSEGKWRRKGDGTLERQVVSWAHRGWGVLDDVVVMNWHGMRGGWLTVTASIPRLIHGENAILASGGDWRTGLGYMRDIAMNELGVVLPGLDETGVWRYHRVDPVWAWPCPPGPYLGALAVARLPYTVTQVIGGDVRWLGSRGKKRPVKARGYDKARESGHDVDRPLRLERQMRSPGKRKPLHLDGREIGPWVPLWDERVVLAAMRETMTALGLDRPIPCQTGARAVLVDAYGRRHGDNLAGHLALAGMAGGWHLVDRPRQTVARWQREIAAAGVRGLSLAGELPALAMPE